MTHLAATKRPRAEQRHAVRQRGTVPGQGLTTSVPSICVWIEQWNG